MKLALQIQPGAKRTEIIGWVESRLKIKIKAPPVDGKANEELIRFLAKEFDLPKRDISILHGHTGRIKLVEIPVSDEQFQQWLSKSVK